MDLGYYQAPTDLTAFDDGWIRTFGDTPEFTEEELKLLKGWKKEGKFGAIMIYLTGKKYRNLSSDSGEFVLRELLRGNLFQLQKWIIYIRFQQRSKCS